VNSPAEDARVLAEVRDWLERAVIGLNLCPFARAPYLQGRVRFSLSHATDEDALLDDLVQALRRLQAEPAEQ
jgi:hypothetical protein